MDLTLVTLHGGLLKFCFGSDMPLRNLKVPNGPILGQILSKSPDFFQNFEKSTHSHTKFSILYGSFIYQEADFATHVGGTSPATSS